MKSKVISWSGRYERALHQRLSGSARKKLPASRALGQQALALGLEILDVARIHENAMLREVPEGCSARQTASLRRRAGQFFGEALAPIEDSNRNLKHEIAQRMAAETALLKSEQHQRALLDQSRQMEQRMRHLSHRVLSAQEEERKSISRELHDQVAQMLASINVHLATLKGAASLSHVGLHRKVNDTQRLVEKSVRIIHRFARELRPPVLDDLGLIPALQTLGNSFAERSGIRIRLVLPAEIEEVHGDKRTVLYRVAQEALSNVEHHSGATRVTVVIKIAGGSVRLRIEDNGVGFNVERVLYAKKVRRLGLIGMQERAEMVGGKFFAQSSVKSGTVISVVIPLQGGRRT